MNSTNSAAARLSCRRMQPFPQGHGRSLRVASVLLALLVLLAVVAFASRTGFGHASNTTITPSYVSWASASSSSSRRDDAGGDLGVRPPNARAARTRPHRSFQMRVIRGLAFILLLGVFFLVGCTCATTSISDRGSTTSSSGTGTPRDTASPARAPTPIRRRSNGPSCGWRSPSWSRPWAPGSGGEDASAAPTDERDVDDGVTTSPIRSATRSTISSPSPTRDAR